MKRLIVQPITTSLYEPTQTLGEFLRAHLRGVELEGRVLAITSKIVSLAEGRVRGRSDSEKRALIIEEADLYLCPGPHGVQLTITDGLLTPSAGIDESNSVSDDYILLPENPYQSAFAVWSELRASFSLNNFGVILTDSRSTPLRRGVNGIALSHWGFKAVRSLVGRPDLHGKPLQFTHVNVADALATAAVLMMGEANESCPLALIEGADVEFSEETRRDEIAIAPADDLFSPLFRPYL